MPVRHCTGSTAPATLPMQVFQSLASDRIVRRGLAYAHAGRVLDLIEAGGRIEARVQGTRREPYLVHLEHDGEEFLASCTCPFDWEPFCKHALAVLAVRYSLDGHEPPDSASGVREVERSEIEVRRQRGAEQGFRVKCRDGNGYFGVFDVHSPSEKDYVVEIRSLVERVNRCSCRDYAGSTLGTCKHIEAVLAALLRRGKRKFAAAAARPPAVAQLLVDRRDTPRIRLHLPPRPTAAMSALAQTFFDDNGFLRGDPAARFADLRARAHRIRGLIMYDDVPELIEQLASERRAEERRGLVAREILAAGARVPGVRARLYPYQVEGAAFLAARGRGLLGDDMGLGKTVQAIAAARILWDRGELRRALIVCPASLKSQWASEIQRFSGMECRIVEGSVPMRLDAYRQHTPFTVANYEIVLRDAERIRKELGPDLLILDEAQRIRNWRTQTAEAIKSLETTFAFVLTGTPLQNRLDDLYSVMQVVDRRALGPLWAYNESFVVRAERGHRILGYRNLDELRRRMAPHLLRRTKEEVKLQLPERIVSRIGVELTSAQRDLMDEAVATAARLAALAERRPLTPQEEKQLMRAMQNARMACNAAGLVDKETVGSPKLDEFEELIRDLCLERGRKVLVFSEWERFGHLAAERAQRMGLGFTRLHGGVPTRSRGAVIERFRDDPECLLMFSTDAGGVGLNLQFASTMINLELPWNPAVLEQRIGRIHRHGQTETVHVILLVSENSFESGLEGTLQAKRELANAALDRGATATRVAASSSCLGAVRGALAAMADREDGEDGEDGEDREPESRRAERAPATHTMRGEDAGATRAATPAERARKAAELMGSRLQRVVQTVAGEVVALVDDADDAMRSAAAQAGVVAVEARAEQLMAPLQGSPLAGAHVLLERPARHEPRAAAERDERVSVAARKLAAARTLAAAGLGAEAIEQAHASMVAVMHALATGLSDGQRASEGAHGTDDAQALGAARLLYEILVPQGVLSLERAAMISRAEGLARAYGTAPQAADRGLVETVLADAESLLRVVESPAPLHARLADAGRPAATQSSALIG